MSTMVYQCPCCGAPLAYGAESGRLECSACGNSYDPDVLEIMNQPEEGEGVQFEAPKATFVGQDTAHMSAYICKACGAELMTDDTTTATECPYCGSPTILPERIEGGVRPELVVPFTVSREQAQAQFEAYFKGKRLLPNVFAETRNRISEMRMLYVPYWLFDCSVSGQLVLGAERKRVTREGDWQVTYTDHFVLNRAGVMDFSNIPVDGSRKIDDAITESLEPYDLSAAVPFTPAVLAGAMADHADVDSDDCTQRVRQRVESSMEQALRSTVTGYTSVQVRSRNFSAGKSKVTPVLMPVWLITTEKEGRTYTFAINGQTGKLCCDVPADTKKSTAWGFGVFAGVFALGCALMALGGMPLDGMMLVLAAAFAAIAGFGTVAALKGELRQAESAQGAGQYAVQQSFTLGVNSDHYLHTTQTRVRVEQSAPQGTRPPMNGPVQGGARPMQNMRPPMGGGMTGGPRSTMNMRAPGGMRPPTPPRAPGGKARPGGMARPGGPRPQRPMRPPRKPR